MEYEDIMKEINQDKCLRTYFDASNPVVGYCPTTSRLCITKHRNSPQHQSSTKPRIKRIMTDKKIWHDLRTKPEKWKHVLVLTGTARYPFRICFVNDLGWWMDATKTSFFYPKSCNKPPHRTNDFKVKRWAYINDLEQL